jgi:hypothetical protein
MQRSRFIFFIVVVLLVTLALPAIAHADETVEPVPTESVVTATEPALEPVPDGWTWDEAAPAPGPVPDGWTWDEVTAPG